ncbi:MAG TPA: hypothetical protein VKB19_14585 [Pedobacter sp.]|nr:hypothetical protein [Pedobacter sp.]
MRDLAIIDTTILSDNWYVLKKLTYEFTGADGTKKVQNREAYDRGNGAAILLYNKHREKVILTRQFRLPTFINGNSDGMLIEVCAGLLDKDDPENCIKRKTRTDCYYIHNRMINSFCYELIIFDQILQICIS